AEELLRRQYASVGAAASGTRDAEAEGDAQPCARGDGAGDLVRRSIDRAANAAQFIDAYRRYCWSVTSLDDLSLAPFQVLATEGRVRALEPHPWHLDVLGRLADADPKVPQATRALEVDLDDPQAE